MLAINDKIKRMRKIKNNTRAISMDIISTPVNPKAPAIIASNKNVITACNIHKFL
jgi:hypothetical protein